MYVPVVHALLLASTIDKFRRRDLLNPPSSHLPQRAKNRPLVRYRIYLNRRSKRRVLAAWLRRTQAAIAGQHGLVEGDRQHRRRVLRRALRGWAIAGAEMALRREQDSVSDGHARRCKCFIISESTVHRAGVYRVPYSRSLPYRTAGRQAGQTPYRRKKKPRLCFFSKKVRNVVCFLRLVFVRRSQFPPPR